MSDKSKNKTRIVDEEDSGYLKKELSCITCTYGRPNSQSYCFWECRLDVHRKCRPETRASYYQPKDSRKP